MAIIASNTNALDKITAVSRDYYDVEQLVYSEFGGGPSDIIAALSDMFEYFCDDRHSETLLGVITDFAIEYIEKKGIPMADSDGWDY